MNSEPLPARAPDDGGDVRTFCSLILDMHVRTTRDDHLFEVIVDTRLEMMDERPRTAKSERVYLLTADPLQDSASEISQAKQIYTDAHHEMSDSVDIVTADVLRRCFVERHGDENDVVFEILEEDFQVGTV